MTPLKTGFLALSLLVSFSALCEDKPHPVSLHQRFLIRTRSAVMGVRGLDEEDLKEAKPDPQAVDALEKYAPSAGSMERFARFKGKTLRALASESTQTLAPAEQADEAKLGRDVAATILGAAPLIGDKDVQRYVNEVGTWVALQSERPALKWRFGVVASDSVNAFAVPGGYVFITAGLYQKLRTESELAGVLGHEISHVVARDHYKVLGLVKAMNAATGMARNVMASMPAFKKIANIALDNGAMVFTLSLDKSQEFAADQKGLMLAADAGYEPYGLSKVLEHLKLVPHDDSKAALLFKTHPTPEERLTALEPLKTGRIASKATNPDLRERFKEFDLTAMKLVRRAPARLGE